MGRRRSPSEASSKHLAFIEDLTFTRKFLGKDPGSPWKDVDWDADADWEWRSAIHDDPQELDALWKQAVQRSRDIVAGALTHVASTDK